MLGDSATFYDRDALLYRLTDALQDTDKEVVFVVGAPLTAPVASSPGVADVEGVVALIRQEFGGRTAQLNRLDAELATADNRYQAAFDFLYGRGGQDAANRVIRKAVAQALGSSVNSDKIGPSLAKLSNADLSLIDKDISVWSLSPAVDALGTLIARFPKRFGKVIITSNFDPLIEVSIKRHNGQSWRTALSSDGSLFQSSAPGCQVVHIHGYWHSSDTLHTTRQLLKSRPNLMKDLLTLIHDKIVVVMGYGGWPDIFTGALSGVVSNENLLPEVLWAFYGEQPTIPSHLEEVLRPGLERTRVTLYKGIDCHQFLPDLLKEWEQNAAVEDTLQPLSQESLTGIATDESRLFQLAPLDCDRPPSVDVWVGRERELRALEISKAKVVALCGLGGEGKSVLASYYIQNLSEHDTRYRFWDWRDCKEQSDRIRTQLTEMIVRLSNESFSAETLSELEDSDLVEVIIGVCEKSQAVLVLDNVDSHVDLENRIFTGLLQQLILAFSSSSSNSRLILTCRPEVEYASSSVMIIKVSGISLDETKELFALRAPGLSIKESDIEEAHRQTDGHAFELDLIAVQVTKVPGMTLGKLLDDMRRGRGGRPDVLSSIWDKLPLREQTLLRYMAEAVRPETEETIQRFCSSKLTFKNFSKAFQSLKSLALIVVKQEQDAPDLHDLHPLVRHFVRTKFERSERTGVIKGVLQQYESIIGIIGSLMGIHLPFSLLERWSQKVELQVSASLYEAAFDTLINVEDAMIGGGHLQEYVRVARLLFENIDWETAPVKYKQFDKVVGILAFSLEQLGEHGAVDRLIQRYEDTVPNKTARYINLCDVNAYVLWLRGEFDDAVDWARRGDTLKEESQVDTGFDCKHNLALAQRDAGDPEAALTYFLKGHSVEEFTSPEQNIDIDGAAYGNVGRCLHLLNRIEEALICYRRSMNILEDQTISTTKSNQAYARRWAGSAYLALGNSSLAEAFFVDAIRVLNSSAPSRVRELVEDLALARGDSSTVMGETAAAQVVRSWIKQ